MHDYLGGAEVRRNALKLAGLFARRGKLNKACPMWDMLQLVQASEARYSFIVTVFASVY